MYTAEGAISISLTQAKYYSNGNEKLLATNDILKESFYQGK